MSMRIHHLNCISTCPLGGKLMDDRTESSIRGGHLACHCLLVETDAGLLLIDTGLGLRDVLAPEARLSRFFLSLVSPDFREDMTAVRQIARLGFHRFHPRDVQHIVLTHLDFDHAGGLDDFPHARFYQWMMEKDRRARLWNRERLRQLRRTHAHDIEVFCAHDLVELERLSGRSAEVPAEKLVRHVPAGYATRDELRV